MTRLLVFLAFLLVSFAAPAATVADRSPFTQGLWWDPTRSGHGFDIFNVGNDVSILWYTYDANGRATWYSAQGALGGTSTDTLTLMSHRWVNGQHAPPTPAGTIRLTVSNPEGLVANWTLGSTQGSWTLKPFTTSGVINEVSHTGTWFDPKAAGWGLSFTEQGDVTGGILFTYDTTGAPTWYSGFGRDGRSVEMFAFGGACPSCGPGSSTSPTSRSVGRLSYDFDQEWQMTLHSASLNAPMATGIAIEGAHVFQLGRMASLRAADRTLASFPDDASLKSFILAGYQNIYTPSPTNFSAAPPSAAAATTTFSTTNLQEAGVDEADLVKTDGQYIYTFGYADGVRKPVIRIAQAGANGSSLAIRGSYALVGGASTPVANAGLYLSGSTLASVTSTQPVYYFTPGGAWYASGIFRGGTTSIEIMGLASPDAPSTRWRAEMDGYVLTSRRIGDRLYVVTRFVPIIDQPATSVPLSAMLPAIRVNGGASTPLLDPSSVLAPPLGERAVVADLVVITAIDLAAPRVVQALAVIGLAETFYASPQNLYIATTRSNYRYPMGMLLPVQPSMITTDLHQIRLDATGMRYVASGSIEGFLGGDIDKAAFRLGEYSGQLRAVSSSTGMWNGTNNKLSVLEPSTYTPALLRTVSVLPNPQHPESLGKPGELLYATRFVGDRLYAVTFKQIDPLYVVDLSNAADPKIAGSVQLPGFSDYLHPMPGGLLLGFGKDACPAAQIGDGQFAWYQGLQLALFDVSNPNQPRQVQQLTMGKRGSTSALLVSHHAFSALAQPDGSTTIAIPGRIHDGTVISNACDSTSYAWKESGLMRFDLRTTGAGPQLTQRPSLITHSAAMSPAMVPNLDPAADGGRSILFNGGIVYVGNGQFWRQDAAGNTSGPF